MILLNFSHEKMTIQQRMSVSSFFAQSSQADNFFDSARTSCHKCLFQGFIHFAILFGFSLKHATYPIFPNFCSNCNFQMSNSAGTEC